VDHVWPLVLGFTLSGFVQSLLPRDGLRAHSTDYRRVRGEGLGARRHLVVVRYAASAMSRALFARGASWTNSIIS